MLNSIIDVPGIKVGHAHDEGYNSGCTVILCGPDGAVPGVDSRGGAPGTRETDCLQPENVVPITHGIFLSGGSAYGLACGTGIMKYLEEHKVGFNVGPAVVPIVAGAVLNDLAFADSAIRPDEAMGYRACINASETETRQGNIGAGVGCCIGRLAGNATGSMKGGLGTASFRVGDLIVGALVAVNCNGDVRDPDTGKILAGTLDDRTGRIAGSRSIMSESAGLYREGFPSNTTIGVIATNAAIDKAAARRIAMIAHDGYARTIDPVHTLGDGDVIFCLGKGTLPADLNRVGAIAAWTMAQAVVNAVRNAESLHGIPNWKDITGASDT
ncbi:MAG: P1 family peptidase [Spirochaetales bacterium]|nr:P1 family peptidase [Spirochaetales bacterium]